MTKRRVAIAAVLVGAAGLVLASAASGQRLHYGQHSWTDVVGFSGVEVNEVLTPHRVQTDNGELVFGRGLLGIAFYHGSDHKPSGMKLRYRIIGKRGSEQTGLRRHADWHTENWTPQRNFSGSPTQFNGAHTGAENTYVTGVNVCTSQTGATSGNTIQGLRVFLSRHNGGNNLERVGTAETYRTSDCRRWHTRQNCPRGAIGTGVRVHTAGSRARGLQLRCTALVGRD